jgi:transposase-like protein
LRQYIAVGWYLRVSLSYRNVEELLTERGLPADHTTIWRWVQCYAPELNKRCRRELKPTNRSWRVDETYVRVKGKWTYLYRCGFHRRHDRFSYWQPCVMPLPPSDSSRMRYVLPRPRVINVDGNPSYPKGVAELKAEGKPSRPVAVVPVLT